MSKRNGKANRHASNATPWTVRVRAHLCDANGRIRHGSIPKIAAATGLPMKALYNAISYGIRPRNEGPFVVAVARSLGLDPVDLLDPNGGTRAVGASPVESGVSITGPRFRKVLLMASSPKGRAELRRVAAKWCERNGVA